MGVRSSERRRPPSRTRFCADGEDGGELLLELCVLVVGSTQNPLLVRAAWPQCASRSAVLLACWASPMCVMRQSCLACQLRPVEVRCKQ